MERSRIEREGEREREVKKQERLREKMEKQSGGEGPTVRGMETSWGQEKRAVSARRKTTLCQ